MSLPSLFVFPVTQDPQILIFILKVVVSVSTGLTGVLRVSAVDPAATLSSFLRVCLLPYAVFLQLSIYLSPAVFFPPFNLIL